MNKFCFEILINDQIPESRSGLETIYFKYATRSEVHGHVFLQEDVSRDTLFLKIWAGSKKSNIKDNNYYWNWIYFRTTVDIKIINQLNTRSGFTFSQIIPGVNYIY